MFKRLTLLFFFASFSSLVLAAPGDTATDRATSYEVEVSEAKLCTDSLCGGGFVVGSGSQEFDIAGVAAGAEVGSYASINNLPAGTYTHIRVLVSRDITISGTCTVSGTATTVDEQTESIPNDGGTTDPFVGKTAADGMYWFNAGKTIIAIIQPLPAPLTVSDTLTTPTVTVKFNTSSALFCVDTGPGGILLFPAEPDVEVSVL